MDSTAQPFVIHFHNSREYDIFFIQVFIDFQVAHIQHPNRMRKYCVLSAFTLLILRTCDDDDEDKAEQELKMNLSKVTRRQVKIQVNLYLKNQDDSLETNA